MIYLDLDGVLCDFAGSAIRLFREPEEAAAILDNWPRGEWDIHKILNVSPATFWQRIDTAGEDWWALLPEYQWAQTLLRVVADHDEFTIASSPSLHPSSSAGKIRWMKSRFHDGFRAWMLGEHKHLLAGPGRTLIDDSERNCERFTAAGGRAILFPAPWNTLGGVVDPVSYVVNKLGAKL